MSILEGGEQPQFALATLSASGISVQGRHFVDKHGRVLDLRGANVGSASKVPIRPSPPLDRHAESSYIGRPFPLEEADEHWQRLKSYGFNFFRINVTWDALEHTAQGVYDEEYLDYLRQLLLSMHKHGLVAYLSIHQDVWSRYCGGSGAPGWTLEAAGFDLSNNGENLALSGAAFLDGVRGGRLAGERGLWPTGYQKLACASMSTLFWGGSTFAPSAKIEKKDGKSVNLQQYLQESFLAAVEKLANAVGDLDGVLGIELMNEPHPGFIGLPTLHEWNYNTDLHLGQYPSPLASFSLGAGHPTKVPYYTRSFPWPTRQTRTVLANPTSAKAWASGACIWEKEGVWRWSEQKGQAVALQDDYFQKDRKGQKVEFYSDCFLPFVKKWDEMIGRTKMRNKMRMVAPVPNEFCPPWPESSRPKNFVYAPHWYDLNALFKKQFGFMTVNVQGLSRGMFFLKALYFGREAAKKNYALQIQNSVVEARKQLGEVPIVFGECGVPMDLNKEEAIKTGDFKWQERMMDSLLSALEGSVVGYNLWAYNPQSRDDVGDDWNAEHFSWYSNHNRDLALKANENISSAEAGSRLLNVLVRPYAVATAGTPLSISFDHTTSTFCCRFTHPAREFSDAEKDPGHIPSISHVTEIFLPGRVYPASQVKISLSSGGRYILDSERERLWVWFVDPYVDPRLKTKDKTRRVDIWVPERAGGKSISTSQGVYLVLFAVFWLLIGLWLQRRETAAERRLGLTPWWEVMRQKGQLKLW